MEEKEKRMKGDTTLPHGEFVFILGLKVIQGSHLLATCCGWCWGRLFKPPLISLLHHFLYHLYLLDGRGRLSNRGTTANRGSLERGSRRGRFEASSWRWGCSSCPCSIGSSVSIRTWWASDVGVARWWSSSSCWHVTPCFIWKRVISICCNYCLGLWYIPLGLRGMISFCNWWTGSASGALRLGTVK